MLITKTCPFTGKDNTLDIDVTENQLREWKQGAMIQDAMPNLTENEREFIMTGILPEIWTKYVG
ncbi:MAG: hypothetical protein CMC15_15995 [Flavobacteriaceae bacterium]|jgi:hypothetical protein|nr:hypothetical protein [Flavobacteriaceae bacterium]|tara:strand:- start:3156 stop:3347 length:192 start_codon:yes stop_codon:yes gene_type:complete